jgi:hypothetical protein
LLLPSAKFHPSRKTENRELRLFRLFPQTRLRPPRPGPPISLVSPPSCYAVATCCASKRMRKRTQSWPFACARFAPQDSPEYRPAFQVAPRQYSPYLRAGGLRARDGAGSSHAKPVARLNAQTDRYQIGITGTQAGWGSYWVATCPPQPQMHPPWTTTAPTCVSAIYRRAI